MALHIADPEVSRLATELAKLQQTTKTEALRRALRTAIGQHGAKERAAQFRNVALQIIKEAKEKSIEPVTKEEMDEMWGD
jgi:hypothetical protein